MVFIELQNGFAKSWHTENLAVKLAHFHDQSQQVAFLG
jgi:hypothetical protein